MGIAKTEIFTQEQNEIASVAKVLGHPARIAILQHLKNVESCICGHLVMQIGLAQATVSQHLKVLKDANLIRGSIEGTKICYCINTQKWNSLKIIFQNFLVEVPDQKPKCC